MSHVPCTLPKRGLLDLAKSGTLEQVRECVVSGANLEDIDSSGNNALHLAVKFNKDQELSQYLYDMGVDAFLPNKEGIRLIHLLAGNGPLNIFKKVLENTQDVDIRTNLGVTALHFAVQTFKPFAIALLLQRRAEVNAVESHGRTPLHFVWSADIAETLIKAGANPNAPNKYGDTPLHTAACRNRPELIQLYVAHGANIDARGNAGATPLVRAMMMTPPSIGSAIVLLESGADPTIANNHGVTLACAAENFPEVGLALAASNAKRAIEATLARACLKNSTSGAH